MNAGTSDHARGTGGINTMLAMTASNIAGAPIAQDDELPLLRITQSKVKSNTRDAMSDGLLCIFRGFVFIFPDPDLLLQITGRLLPAPHLQTVSVQDLHLPVPVRRFRRDDARLPQSGLHSPGFSGYESISG